MGLSSKKQKTSSSETSTAKTTPDVPSFLSQPYQTFASNVSQLNPSGMGAVGPSALQQGAFSAAQGLGSNQGLTDAQNATRGLLGFQPSQVSAGTLTAPAAYQSQQVATPGAYTPQAVTAPGAFTPQQVSASPVTAGQLASTDLSAYFNPYQQNVIDLSLADLERSRAGAISAGQGAATSAGAYGGSRHGVADSLTNEAFGRTAAQTAANLRSQGFLNAQQAAGEDINRRYGADTFNAGQSLQAQGMNQGAGLTAGLANNASQLQAGQFNLSNALQAALANQNAGLQGAQFNLGAANQLGALGSAAGADARANAGLMGDLGEQQRAIELEQDPWRRQAMALAMQGGLLGAIPANLFTGQTVNASGTSNSTTTQTPSALDSIGRMAQLGMMLFGGKGG